MHYYDSIKNNVQYYEKHIFKKRFTNQNLSYNVISTKDYKTK